jgi:hypothetical protein
VAVRPRDGVALLDGPAQHGPMIRRASKMFHAHYVNLHSHLHACSSMMAGDPVTRCSGTMRVHLCELVT